ncbi:hypothetical protein HMPREF1864_00913 [Peptoniphilus sp. DNF00840]|nr:hypothetical protein HMPREF1864_00913 [Peptoniphilus sp. DNF00840]
MSLAIVPNLLKAYEFVKFANKSQANKAVSKNFGDVKKFQCLSDAS